jgi:hypothetical protein
LELVRRVRYVGVGRTRSLAGLPSPQEVTAAVELLQPCMAVGIELQAVAEAA